MDHQATSILDLPLHACLSAEADGLLDDLVDRSAAGRYITFDLGKKRFCIFASSIAEITGPLTSTFLPNSPDCVAGLAPFRGEALAVILLRELLQTGGPDPDSRPKYLVLRDGGTATRIAFEIDRLLEVVDGSDADFNIIEAPGVIDAEFRSDNGHVCSRIDAARLYSLLHT